jgi:hypothetical protein
MTVDRIRATSSATGTNPFNLVAVAGYRQFSDEFNVASGLVIDYVAEGRHSSGAFDGQVEFGVGQIDVDGRLARTTVTWSSSGVGVTHNFTSNSVVITAGVTVRAIQRLIDAYVAAGLISHTELQDIGSNSHATIDIALSTLASHVADTSNPHSVTATQVGLGNVDNTSDLNKPISTATQTALNGKENTITATSSADYYRGDKTFQPLNKAAVGLSNVDNTSDANKPVSSAQQLAIDAKVADVITDGVLTIAPSQNAVFDALALKENSSNKGIANGYVPLNASTLIDSIYLPSFVDDILEFSNLAAFPVTGETGKIYIAIDTSKTYRWSGTVYVELTDATAVWGSISGTLSNQTDLNSALNSKEPTIAAGTTLQYWRGDKSWQTLNTSVVPELTNLYFTDARARTAAVADSITDGVLNIAPSQNAVFDALAGKAALSHTHVVGELTGLSSTILVGRHAAGTGVGQEVSVGNGLEFSGSGIRRSALTGAIEAAAGSNTTAFSAASQAILDAKVVGPASATDNAIARYNGTTGKLIQGSVITISDTGVLDIPSGSTTGAMVVGADTAATTRSSNVRKIGRINAPSYSNTYNIGMISSDSFDATTDKVIFGSAWGSGTPAPTQLIFGTVASVGLSGANINETITVDGSSSSVFFGSGTSNVPLARVHVKGRGATSATTAFRVDNSSNTQNFSVRDDGRVGIASTTFLAQLDISNFTTTYPQMKLGTLEFQSISLNNWFIADNIYYNGSAFKARAAGGGNLFTAYSGGIEFRLSSTSYTLDQTVSDLRRAVRFNPDGSVAFGNITGTGAFPLNTVTGANVVIEADGDTSIGLTTPSARLHVKGSGATSATKALEIDNSLDVELLAVRNDGLVLFSEFIAPKTSNYTVLNTENRTNFSNTGATGTVVFTLPTAVAGLNYRFASNAAQIIQITAGAGDVIRRGASVSTSGGNVQTTASLGNVINLVAIDVTTWLMVESIENGAFTFA